MKLPFKKVSKIFTESTLRDRLSTALGSDAVYYTSNRTFAELGDRY